MPNIASRNNNNDSTHRSMDHGEQDSNVCKMEVDTNEKSPHEFTIKFAKNSSGPSNHTPLTTTPHSNNTTTTTTTTTTKPVPGSVEWYELRKENHKKVERKRRETINQAMDDLGAVIPGNEKNKSRILGRAVQHIKGLMEEIIGLRKQVDHYRLTTQQQQVEIANLKARLEAQDDGSMRTPCPPPVISS